MQLQTTLHDSITVVSLQGSLDTLTAGDVTAALNELIQAGQVKLVLDFQQVDYVSSAGLRVLLGAVKETRRAKGDLRLAGLARAILDILEMAGFTSIVKYYTTVPDALQSYKD